METIDFHYQSICQFSQLIVSQIERQKILKNVHYNFPKCNLIYFNSFASLLLLVTKKKQHIYSIEKLAEVNYFLLPWLEMRL